MVKFNIPQIYEKELGAFLRELRKENGMRAKDLAIAMVKSCDVDYKDDLMLVYCLQQKIYKWEECKSEPKTRDLILLARALDLPLDYFAVFFEN